MSQKRKIEVLVISDIHLGTYGAHARELNQYLRSIDPDTIVINGDWIDIWNLFMNFWPAQHTENIFIILDFVKQGKPVYYLTGNHDEMLRKYTDFKLGTFELIDELILELDGKKHWFLHGDQYDLSVGDNAKWLAKLGGVGYDYLIRANRGINSILTSMGRERVMVSKMVKDNVKKVVKSNVSDFEELACQEGIRRAYDYVICGHVHNPQIRKVENGNGSVTYLNAGDWLENCTALEYNDGEWNIFYFFRDFQGSTVHKTDGERMNASFK